MTNFKVGDKVNYVPDPEDPTRYLVPSNKARVALIESPELAGRYYIGIRFEYNPEIFPVLPGELEKVEEEKE